ncbi:MAG: hypothetical protein IT392_12865 [Nitrospirae bacterium]|nr:hypothetical protein [Nitrospirota bacterium]
MFHARNFEKIQPYQTYLQYKGPLGKWNIRAGHYILPFGLLADYDTERLVLRTLEPLSLGIKLDTGVELLGFVRDMDYAVSVSQGVGRERLSDVDDNKLFTGRIGWQGDDVNIGLSILNGRVLMEEGSFIRNETGADSLYERLLGIDLTWYHGSLILRGEATIGKDNDKGVGGFLAKADYAVTPDLEINLKYALNLLRNSPNSLPESKRYSSPGRSKSILIPWSGWGRRVMCVLMSSMKPSVHQALFQMIQ